MRNKFNDLGRRGAAMIWLLVVSSGLAAQEQRSSLLDMSLEQLVNLEVTSVSKKEERWFTAPAAVHVITAEDIRRSGATTLAEALRLAPGIHVARYNANQWAIGARGFNSLFSNKLLVLIDGRSVYDLLYSGIYWDVQDVVLEDIARIEVIRGPGGTLWGANAVNGVINVVTKGSELTQGTLASAHVGGEEQLIGTFRQGVTLRPGLTGRVFAKYAQRDRLTAAPVPEADGSWDVARVGGQADWQLDGSNHVSVQGAAYTGDVEEYQMTTQPGPPFQSIIDTTTSMTGGWVLGRWTHRASRKSDFMLQTYVDRTVRKQTVLHDVRTTWDVEARHRFAMGAHEMVWGAGYRFYADHFAETFALAFAPDARQDNLFSFFAQNQFTAVPGRLTITAGTKVEHNDYSGFEIQPNARILWTPHQRHTVWASVARAVRTPSRSDHDLRWNIAVFPDSTGVVTYLSLFGDTTFRPEELVSLEGGYRFRPMRALSVDVSAFYNHYDHLGTLALGEPYWEEEPAPAHAVLPLAVVNGAEGTTHGLEVVVEVYPTAWWRLTGSYSTVAMHIRNKSAAFLFEPEATDESPAHQGFVRSDLDLPGDLELDATVYAVDELRNQTVPGYTRVDARVGWEPHPGLRLSVSLRDALQRRHAEFSNIDGSLLADVERSFGASVTWEF